MIRKLMFILALLGLGSQVGAAAFTRVLDPSQVFDYVDADGIRVMRLIGADSLSNTSPSASGSSLLLIGDQSALGIYNKLTKIAYSIGDFWAGAGGYAANSITPIAAVGIVAMPGFSSATNALRVGLSSTAQTPANVTLGYGNRADTYTATGTGQVLTLTARPLKSFAVAVKGTGAAPTLFTVLLQGSLDGLNWTTILTATQASPGDGQIQWQVAGIASPVLYLRTNTTSLTLGGASDIVATALGLQ